jgi:murein DD-endopeptidase MepM/ murein hydrolase activator NlpD
MSGGGRGMGSYQPETTGALPPPPPPPPRWSREGGTAITVEPGETIETIARRHGVPVNAIVEANRLPGPVVHTGQRLVIPHYRPVAGAYSPPPPPLRPRLASAAPAPVAPPRTTSPAGAAVHVVVPGETLRTISRFYGKPVSVIARANNIPPDTMVRVGERLVIPGVRASHPAPAPRSAATPAPLAGRDLALAESPHSARVAETEAPPAKATPDKAAEATGGLPSFGWPVRGRIIAGFGPKPNGSQNDGINVAVPDGTPVKAASDGVVAYAGNELKGYGNLVLLRHADGFVTAYANASEILVKRGETVKRGQTIARSGETGNVTSPQLHFEIRKGATPVDPARYLNGA